MFFTVVLTLLTLTLLLLSIRMILSRRAYRKGTVMAWEAGKRGRVTALYITINTIVQHGLEMNEEVLASPLPYRPATLYGQLFGMRRAAMLTLQDLNNEVGVEYADIRAKAIAQIKLLDVVVDEAMDAMTK
ncbi:MAG: hypothetical protein E6R03_06845 [Hyphomicrobiaceae bacterium]|nr:MAG: hypothetical protein E6R03_06845 [Hyphomicrobiaceae bacterium]